MNAVTYTQRLEAIAAELPSNQWDYYMDRDDYSEYYDENDNPIVPTFLKVKVNALNAEAIAAGWPEKLLAQPEDLLDMRVPSGYWDSYC